jgi:hypothetical protein
MLDKLFKNLDGDTLTLLTRFAMRGVKSGNLNDYIKNHLRKIIDEEDAPPAPPSHPAPRVSTKPVPR